MRNRMDPKKVLEFKFKKAINLYCFTDVHIGSKEHDKVKFKKAITMLQKDPNGYCFFNGDNIDFTPGGYHGAPDEQEIDNNEQLEGFSDLLRSLGKKVLFVRPGNHELRAAQLCDVNIIEHLGRELNLPIVHVGSSEMHIFIGNKRIRMITTHGMGGKSKPVLEKLRYNYEGRDCYFTGHTHEFLNHAEGFVTIDSDTGFEIEVTSAPMLAGGSFQMYSDYARAANMRRTQTGCYILVLDENGLRVKGKIV